MNINRQEAIAILEMWKTARTVLQLSVSRSGTNEKLTVRVHAIQKEVVTLHFGEATMQISLLAADFNGDRRGSPPRSSHGAYLVCEYQNGDRYAFYAPRGEYRLSD
jgi:hypothetical protein